MASPRIGSSSTKVLSSVILILGVIIIVRTAIAGGGPLSVGVLIGVIFVAIGAARLYLSRRLPR
jgi:hypothetical protein